MSSDITNHEKIVTAMELSEPRDQVRCKDIVVVDECNNSVCGSCATAIGCRTKAFGDCSMAEGTSTKAYGSNSHAEGNNTTANGDNSHAEGCTTVAFGNCSHAEGANTNTYADYSHTEGYNTKTRGIRSHAEGISTEANAEGSHAQGYTSRTEGYASFADGYSTVARGSYSHTEGYSTTAGNTFAHAEGYATQANGYASHTEGSNSTAKLDYSHAEGYNTSANYYYAHTEGYQSKADGYAAHAEGYNTSAPGSYAHAEGGYTTANGSYSHAEGYNTIANAPYSHAAGYFTNTKAATGSSIMGIYGDADTPYSWFLGGGTSETNKSLAAKILYTGDAYIKNAWNAGGTGYAELFPSDNQTIDPGYFVTLMGDNVSVISSREDYVLGVTTANPGFVANSIALRNCTSSVGAGKSQPEVTSDLVLPEVKDHEGKVLASEQVMKVPIPAAHDGNATSAVLQDNTGTFWPAVVIFGQVVVYDDGTCKANHYCVPNENGIATAAATGFRVMKRLSDNQVLILFR